MTLTSLSPASSIWAPYFWIGLALVVEARVRKGDELVLRALGSVVFLDRLFAALLAFVDQVGAGVAVAEEDDALGLAGKLLGEARSLPAIVVARVQRVLADDAEPEGLRLLRDALIDDDHDDALRHRLLEGRRHPGVFQLGDDDVRLRRNRVVDLLGVVFHRVDRISQELIVPSHHGAKIALAGADRNIPIACRLGNPDQLPLGAEISFGKRRARLTEQATQDQGRSARTTSREQIPTNHALLAHDLHSSLCFSLREVSSADAATVSGPLRKEIRLRRRIPGMPARR